MATKKEREGHTPAMLLWQTGSQFLHAARKLGTDHSPACYVACHGIELSLKSHLRARGFTLDALRDIGHSILRAQEAATLNGMEAAPDVVNQIFKIAEDVHAAHEFRYPHLFHPTLIQCTLLIRAGGWALIAAAPAVALSTHSGGASGDALLKRMRKIADDLVKYSG